MLKQKFYSFITWTFLEAFVFAYSLFSGQIFWAAIMGLLLAQKIWVAYKVDKFSKENGLV
ncbi:MAG: hypothetical protein FWF42_03250 [Streptococcaceae bacterium]|nr:hypothetical protein [Streptococcaceae bacterium]MCL2858686.1 hypothetical protein [Streptococcaceae bacterium]